MFTKGRNKALRVIIAAMLLLSTDKVLFAYAAKNFQFGDLVYFGNGCPKNAVKIVTVSDGKSWSMLFCDFIT